MSDPITQAVILAAGRGSRLAASQEQPEEFSKPLLEVGGRTLLGHALNGCMEAGVERAVVVTGYRADLVEHEALRFGSLEVTTVFNHRWREPNGLSVLAAREAFAGDFLLLMADHLFDSSILRDLATSTSESDVVLAVDRKLDSIPDLVDATKVRAIGSRIVHIGKTLSEFDAVDCGLFRCSPVLHDALETAARARPPSLTDGLTSLIESGEFSAYDIGDRWWRDVDTIEAATAAARDIRGEGFGKGHWAICRDA